MLSASWVSKAAWVSRRDRYLVWLFISYRNLDFFLTEASKQRQDDYFMSACHLLCLQYRLDSPEPPHACVRVQYMPRFRFSIFFLHSSEYLKTESIIFSKLFIVNFIFISGCQKKFLRKIVRGIFEFLHYEVTKRFSGIWISSYKWHCSPTMPVSDFFLTFFSRRYLTSTLSGYPIFF